MLSNCWYFNICRISGLTFCCQSASNDFWGKRFLSLYGESKMTQNLSILTGCSAGATVRNLNITLSMNSDLKWSSRKVSLSYHLNLLKSSQSLHFSPEFHSDWQVLFRLQDKTSTFKGPLDVVMQVIRKEGLFGLYAGMESTFWRPVMTYLDPNSAL